MKTPHHIGWRYFILESTFLWKNLFSDGTIRKPCTYLGKRIFLLKNLRKRRLLNRRPLSGTTCSLEPDRRPSANITGSKNAFLCISVFLWSCISLFALCLAQLAFWLSDHEQSGNINGSKIYSTGKSLAKNQGKSKTLRWKDSHKKQKTQLKLSNIKWK